MAVSFLLVELVSWHLQGGVLSLAASMRMGAGGVEGMEGGSGMGLEHSLGASGTSTVSEAKAQKLCSTETDGGTGQRPRGAVYK